MIRISKLSDYAALIMNALALDQGRLYSAAALSRELCISMPTVGKLLKILQEVKLVVSQRGATGGYRLARDPGEITVADIVKAIEGAPMLTECSDGSASCAQFSVCSLKGNWQLVNLTIMKVLDSLTLADMAGSLGNHPLIKSGIQFKGVDVVIEER